MQKAALINIDCDLYISTKLVLNFITTLICEGTIIIFDDWYSFRRDSNLGAQKAFAEWKLNMLDWHFAEYQKQGPWSNSFIANHLH